jgi:hypothetical protein
MRRLVPGVEASRLADAAPQPGAFGQTIAAVRHDTTRILVGALGEPRMRELRAQGEAMDEDQICTFARRHIDEFLTSHTDQLQ